jgi:four helix bundle protein
MKKETIDLLDRTFNFGVNCLQFLSQFPNNDLFRVPKYQLAKSSTSIGANYQEAQVGESRKDFIHKIGIVLKEAKESNYWLRIIDAGGKNNKVANQKTLSTLLSESDQLIKIFATIKINSQKK